MGSMVFTVMAALAQMELEIKRERINDSVSKRRAAGRDPAGRRQQFTESQILNARRLVEGGGEKPGDPTTSSKWPSPPRHRLQLKPPFEQRPFSTTLHGKLYRCLFCTLTAGRLKENSCGTESDGVSPLCEGPVVVVPFARN